MFGVSQTTDTHQHHHDSAARVARQERNVAALKAVVQPQGVFNEDEKQLHNFMTKQVLREEAEASILNMEGRGEEAKRAFLESRLCGDINLWHPMTLMKFLNWDDLCKKTKL
jgi:hypothetical protein